MSLSPAQENYLRDISLVDRKINLSVTYVGEGVLDPVKNNLDEYFLKCEVINSGNVLTDNCRFTFRIDAVGTFIRTAPILMDENAKFNYLIDFQIKQGSASSKLFRFEISQAIIQEDEKFGEVLVIVGRGREYIFKESITSRPLFFLNPAEAFDERINDFSANTPGDDGPAVGNVTNNLTLDTDVEPLQQNWIPTGPITIQRSIQQILDRVALPAVSGGVLKDFYWDADADPASSKFFDLVVAEFGSLPVLDADRVEINPEKDTEAEQKDKTVVSENVIFKNQIILRGSPSHGSLPMDYVRFSSAFEHARRRKEWDSTGGTSYTVGQHVKRTIAAVVTGEPKLFRYFECLVANNSTTLPEINQSQWEEDFTQYSEFQSNGSFPVGGIFYHIAATTTFYQVNTEVNASSPPGTPDSDGVTPVPTPPDITKYTSFANGQANTNFATFKPFSPWTNDAELWKSHMMEGASAPFIGGFVDWNFVRANYSNSNFNNQYGHITHKHVTRQSTTPPSGAELFNGQKILVSATGTVGGWTITGNAPRDADGVIVTSVADKVAELDDSRSLVTTKLWRMSDPPTTNDIVTDLSTMKLLAYDGAAWIDGWTVDDHTRTSPIHPVRNMRYTASASGVLNEALEFQFNWDQESNLIFKESRGVWLNWWFPAPRLALGGHSIGDVYGGTTAPLGTFDANNLEFSSLALRGWNRGLDSEDLGIITALAFKMKFRVEDNTGAKITTGWANMPMRFFAVDLFDRVYQTDFTLRRMDGWDPIIIPFGERAKKKLYFNRIDEVIDIPGITGWNPFGNFFFAQKEYTGVTFDWRFVKMWGIQMKFGYDDADRYNNNAETSTLDLVAGAAQYLLNLPQNLFAARDQTKLVFNIDQSKVTISDLRFIKHLYVNSEETNISDARTEIVNQETEIDYDTAKLAAQGARERRKFFPQTVHIRSFGNVKLRVGHRFILTGDKVPGGEQEMVVQSIKHIIDGTSYKMDIEAKRKFVLP